VTTYKREIRQRTAEEIKKKFPHPWMGIITFSNESKDGQQLIADFVENMWSGFRATKDITASQAFGTSEVKMFVSAKTEKLATDAIDEAIDRLKGGFKKAGESFRLAA